MDQRQGDDQGQGDTAEAGPDQADDKKGGNLRPAATAVLSSLASVFLVQHPCQFAMTWNYRGAQRTQTHALCR